MYENSLDAPLKYLRCCTVGVNRWVGTYHHDSCLGTLLLNGVSCGDSWYAALTPIKSSDFEFISFEEYNGDSSSSTDVNISFRKQSGKSWNTDSDLRASGCSTRNLLVCNCDLFRTFPSPQYKSSCENMSKIVQVRKNIRF